MECTVENLCLSPFFQTVEQFEEELKSNLVSKYTGVTQGIMPEGYLEAPLAYDAIWAVALGKRSFLQFFVYSHCLTSCELLK